ncbi:hypothetical protein M2371_003335 [Buttiauxella sp. BIGb0471]|uniref:hypothetical protein n=1 Tax=Buttiauxella sp. BIGb0471 TaxID=2940597 RepID=UPI002168C03D|nr:hypothetical protein [Buttiauxella sp. BIGb0471]MCS3604099.1 hypothetical protein [Buttiauxella sp. BIGb0471]
MNIYAKFSVKAVGIDDCSAIDFSRYSYIIKLCHTSDRDNVISSEPETKFSQSGESSLHCMNYTGSSSELPVTYCDIYCAGVCTDKIYIKSFSDGESSHDWTVLNKKFSKGETTQSKNYDKICNISSHRIFIDSQFPVGHPDDPFEKSKIERQLAARLKFQPSPNDYMKNKYPDQQDSSLCGPAAFIYSLLKDRPDLYANFIKELWNTGSSELVNITISPSKGTTTPINYTKPTGRTRVPAIDWIALASLRDCENTIMSYSSPDDEISGITMPDSIVNWASAVGSNIIYHEMKITHFSRDTIVQLSQYVDSSNHVAILIDHELLLGGRTGYPTHWVVWESKLKNALTNNPININTSDSELVCLDLFSWGEMKSMNSFDINRNRGFKDFCSFIYGAVVFSKIP